MFLNILLNCHSRCVTPMSSFGWSHNLASRCWMTHITASEMNVNKTGSLATTEEEHCSCLVVLSELVVTRKTLFKTVY